jgi:hypothetical protein
MYQINNAHLTDEDPLASLTLRITAPITILIYIMGLYLLGKLGLRWHSLKADIRCIDREVLNLFNPQ